jgi:putative sigma-54 modulation protein
VQIKISTRHGSLEPQAETYLQDKAEKLQKYFGRLMSIEIEAERRKNSWLVEIFVSAEHKHDFVAREEAAVPEAAMDLCTHKIEQQLRRYKDKVQNHKGGLPIGGISPTVDVVTEPPNSARARREDSV